MKPRTMTAELEQEIREDIDCNPEYRDLLLCELDAERAVSTELLAALREAAVWYGGENHSYECRSNDNADLCDCGVKNMDDRINRAIAKAEGRDA